MDLEDPPVVPTVAPSLASPVAAPQQTGVPQTPRGRGALGVLGQRNFSLLFSGQLISTLGDQVYGLALPWTVLAVTGDPRQMALVLAAEAVPRVLLLLVGGALADRLNPRVVMLAADAGRAAVVGVLGVTLFAGLPPLWVVALLAALQGAGSGLFGPGVPALLPRILPEQDLPAANGLVMVVQYLTLAIGPLLGGVATAAQATLAFLGDAASFVVSALSLFAIRLPARKPPEAADPQAAASSPAQRKGLLREIGSGLGYTFRMPLIRATMMVTVFANMGFAGTFGVALIVLSRALSPSALTLGILLAAAGVGGVIGGLSGGLLGRLPRRGVVGLLLFAITAVFMSLVPLVAGTAGRLPFSVSLSLGTDQRVGAIAVLLGLVGLILALGDTMFLTLMQQRIAPEYMARVFSAQFVAGGIAQPLSLLAAGYLAAVYGPGIVFLAGSACLLVGIALGLSSRELRHI